MKNTSEKIDTKIPIDEFSDSRCLCGEQHDLIKKKEKINYRHRLTLVGSAHVPASPERA